MTIAQRRWFMPVVLVVISLLVSLSRIGRPSYWYDEAATITMLERSPGQLLRTVSDIDLVHLLYYALMKPWEAVTGTSELATRLPSAVVLAVAAAGFALLVRESSGDRAAWIAGTAFVLLPGLSWTGIEARSYAFVLALVVWSMWALQRATRDGARRWWVLFTVLFVLSVLMHVMAVLMVVAHVAHAVAAGRIRQVALADGVALLLLLPFIAVTRTQSDQVGWIDVSRNQLVSDVGIGQLFVGQRPVSAPQVVVTGVLLAAVFAVLAVAALGAWSTARTAMVTAVAWLVAPTVLLALPVLADVQLYQSRYLAFAAPGACWLAALGWQRLGPPRWVGAGVGLVAVAAALVPISVQGTPMAKGSEDYRALADLSTGADAVVFATTDARGIAIAYPDPFASVDDLTLRGAGHETATLWGTQRPSFDEIVLRGRVVAYVGTVAHLPERTATEAELDAAGCRELERMERARWTGVVYECS